MELTGEYHEDVDRLTEEVDMLMARINELENMVLDQVPAQSLAEIQAQAVEKFCNDKGDELTCEMTWDELEKLSDSYAQQLRKVE